MAVWEIGPEELGGLVEECIHAIWQRNAPTILCIPTDTEAK